MPASATSLPYHEPGITTILILTSFLLLCNVVNWALDRIVYCGLIGQILIGIAWGTPGAKWLDESIETPIVQFGYLGLILLVYEGSLPS
jgi:Kef-type K+ transport system membrane component KefB